MFVFPLVALLIGLGAGIMLGRAGWGDQEANGTAAAPSTAVVTTWIAAANRGDAAEIASLYSPDATLVELDREPAITTGTADTIGGQLSWYDSLGGEVQATGPAVAFGSMIAQPMQWGGGERGIQVFEIDDRGLISRQWVLAPTTTPNWR